MKFMIVDDHALIREAMARIFADLHPGCTVFEASSYAAALPIVERHDDLALILLDLNLPDRGGLEILRELRQRFPATAVVMLSAFSDRDTVFEALSAGALGFIPKTQTRDVLMHALQLVFAGGKYIPEDILTDPGAPAATTVAGMHSQAQIASQRSAGATAADAPSPAQLGLTDRQIEVLALMMQGKSNKLICRSLNLAEPTVKNHVSGGR